MPVDLLWPFSTAALNSDLKNIPFNKHLISCYSAPPGIPNSSDITPGATFLPNWKEAVLAVKDQRLNQEHTQSTVTPFCTCAAVRDKQPQSDTAGRQSRSRVRSTFDRVSLYARGVCVHCAVSMGKPAQERLCPCDCCARAGAARGCEGKPIKKCHQAPLSLSQRLQLKSPATKKKIVFSAPPCPLETPTPSPTHTHTHTPCYNLPPGPPSVPREPDEPALSSELKRDESGELEFPADC